MSVIMILLVKAAALRRNSVGANLWGQKFQPREAKYCTDLGLPKFPCLLSIFWGLCCDKERLICNPLENLSHSDVEVRADDDLT